MKIRIVTVIVLLASIYAMALALNAVQAVWPRNAMEKQIISPHVVAHAEESGENRPALSVKVHSSVGDYVRKDELVTIWGELTGFDGRNYSLQWQLLDGERWVDIDGANDITHSFPATTESVNSSYRLLVCFVG